MKIKGIVFITAFLLPYQVIAQDEKEGKIEEVTVTGTHIKGADVTGILPITTLSEDTIENLGVGNGDELIRAIPSQGEVTFHNQDVSGGINDVRGDSSSFNIRSLGTGHSLTLLNSRRMVLQPGYSAVNGVPVVSANPNAIPIAGVSRLEVLHDGASALYGSDAVGGVVNTILRRDFEGITGQVRYGDANGTDRQDFSGYVRAGFNFNQQQTRIGFFADARNRKAVDASERDYAASSDLRPLVEGSSFAGDTDFDNRSANSPWGVFRALVPDHEARAANRRRVYTDGDRIAGDDSAGGGFFRILPADHPSCEFSPAGTDLCFDDNDSVSRLTRYDSNSERQIIPKLDRINLYSTIEHDVDERMTLYGEYGYYRADTERPREQAPLQSSRVVVTVPRTNFYNPFGARFLNADGETSATGTTLNPSRLPELEICSATSCSGANRIDAPDDGLDIILTRYRPVDVGPRVTEVENESYRVLGGVKGELNLFDRDWDYDTAALYSRYESLDLTRNRVSHTLLQQALARNDALAYNPFNGADINNPSVGDATANEQEVLDSIRVDVFKKGETELSLVDFKISNPDAVSLFDRSIGVALGAEWRRETFEDDRDPRLDGTITYTDPVSGDVSDSDVLGSSPTQDSEGSRNVKSLFAEVIVPVVFPSMDIPMVNHFDIQLAGRHEDFSDVGTNSKPRIAASWGVTPAFQFRGNWQEGFRAPNLAQLHQEEVVRATTVSDYVECNADGVAVTDCDSNFRINNVRAGSRDLDPEDSETYSIGFTVSPTTQRVNATFTVDYWQVEQEKLVGVAGDENQVLLDLFLRGQGSFNPNVIRRLDTGCLPGDDFRCTIGTISEIRDPYQNFDKRTVRGIDFGYTMSMLSDAGDFDLSLHASRLLEYDQEINDNIAVLRESSGLPTENQGNLLRLDGLPEWRIRADLRWRRENWGAGVSVRHVSNFEDTAASFTNDAGQIVNWKVDAWTTVNANVSYTFDEGNTPWDRLRLRVGVNNIGDSEPSLADESFGYYGGIHNSTGRYFYFDTTIGF